MGALEVSKKQHNLGMMLMMKCLHSSTTVSFLDTLVWLVTRVVIPTTGTGTRVHAHTRPAPASKAPGMYSICSLESRGHVAQPCLCKTRPYWLWGKATRSTAVSRRLILTKSSGVTLAQKGRHPQRCP